MGKIYTSKVIEFKGQLCFIIPDELCKEFDIKEGTEISIEVTPDGKSLVVKKI